MTRTMAGMKISGTKSTMTVPTERNAEPKKRSLAVWFFTDAVTSCGSYRTSHSRDFESWLTTEGLRILSA